MSLAKTGKGLGRGGRGTTIVVPTKRGNAIVMLDALPNGRDGGTSLRPGSFLVDREN